MRRFIAATILISCLLLQAFTVYDKASFDLLYENPTDSITFSALSDGITAKDDRGHGTYLVPNNAFSSSWLFESHNPGASQFQAVIWSQDDIGTKYIAPEIGFRGIVITIPAEVTGPVGIFTTSPESGFIGVEHGASDLRYGSPISRIYKIAYGYSAIVGTYILMESGVPILMESGDYILME